MSQQREPARFVVNANCSISGTSKGGKPYRKQKVLVHQGDEVLAFEYFLFDSDPYLEPGEYVIAPDAVYVGDIERVQNGRTFVSNGLKVAPRFKKIGK